MISGPKRQDNDKKNCISEEVKKRLISENACYHLYKGFVSFCLLPKNIKINISGTIILPIAVHKTHAGPEPRKPLGQRAHRHTEY
jgi:hypothetical protein